ncbi:MAG: hypothetical protein M1828_000023 [Chrysothrix sp. TS-e1954]|nr:MAG: hypothetical protein M1828_000023 [Chrysothrix sp. TS-e1954]
MPSARVISLCVVLFLASALIPITLRTSHATRSWPSILRQAKSHRLGTEDSHFQDVAFATLLSGNIRRRESFGRRVIPDDGFNVTRENEEEDEKDGYFVGARVLTFVLLHHPEIRSKRPIPFIVLVTKDVSHRKRARLAADGAQVVEVAKLGASWVEPGDERFRDVFAKLRLLQMTKYKKICFIDADMLVTAPLDGIFEDPATDLVRTRRDEDQLQDDEADLPPAYMFAAKSESYVYEHAIPPEVGVGRDRYLNSGFFVVHPSLALFDYYLSLLRSEDKFDSQFPEQNLLNYAHRREGNMPWAMLHWKWNVNWPTVMDSEAGVRSFHAKYWEGDTSHDETLKKIWEKQRIEMDGYYQGIAEGLT